MEQQYPTLRDDLVITFYLGDNDGYVIEDPLRNTFFRIGQREYRFLCQLSSGCDLKKLPVELPEEQNRECEITQVEAQTILNWLASRQLLQNQNPETMQAIELQELSAKKKNLLARLNLISFKVPLFNPDPLLIRVMPWLGWLAGPWAFVFWLFFGVVSLGTLFVHWNSFIAQTAGFFSLSNVFLLGIVWILLKLVHELFHALVCNRYGGQVNEMGILFILFIPLTYVNATSSWGFSSRWQRIHVAVAGMYAELFIAWLAILYWASHGNTVGGLIAYNIVFVAGVSSILFNANPLMRFDGYYVLSDLVQVPNLYFHGIAAVRRYASKFWLGVDQMEAEHSHSTFVLIYGWCVYLWRILVLFSLGYAASGMLGGWGLLITIAAAMGWVFQPLLAFIKRIPIYRSQNPAILSYFFIRFTCFVFIVGFLLFGVNWHRTITIPAVVLFDEQLSVKALAEGFVNQLLVQEGTIVEPGMLLLKLENKELESSYSEIVIEFEILDLKRRQAITNNKYSDLQMLDAQRDVLKEKQQNLDQDRQGLEIRAQSHGKLVGRDLKSLLGTWVHKGQELFQVVSPQNKHLVARSFLGREGEEVQVDMRSMGGGLFPGYIDRISPTASRELPHLSMAAYYGGPFDVKPNGVGVEREKLELFAPRFSVTIQLSKKIRQELRAGQQALVQIRGVARSPGRVIWQKLRSWFLKRQSRR